jgi:hypothetical protein
MDVRATAASTTPSTTDASKTSSTAKSGDAKKSFSALFAEAKDDLKKGESLTKVEGHEFARIKGGERDGMCVNLSGNVRSGETFDLIWRDGRQFHVYGGSGADHKVVEVGHKPATTKATGTNDTSGGTAATPGS